MRERALIEARIPTGWGGGDGNPTHNVLRGYFLAVAYDDDYSGGGYERHKGMWLVLSDETTGAIFKATINQCREVRES